MYKKISQLRRFRKFYQNSNIIVAFSNIFHQLQPLYICACLQQLGFFLRNLCEQIATSLPFSAKIQKTPKILRKTQSFAHIWVAICIAECLLHGTSGDDVDSSNMGVPTFDKPVSACARQTPWAMASFQCLLRIFKDITDEMKHLDREWIEEANKVVADIEDYLEKGALYYEPRAA